jgi:hypothetical protein
MRHWQMFLAFKFYRFLLNIADIILWKCNIWEQKLFKGSLNRYEKYIEFKKIG